MFELNNEERCKITNAIHCTYKFERTEEGVDKLEQLILMAKDCYYAGYPFLTDSAYDQLEELLRKRRPDSKVLEKVGHDIGESEWDL